jgi:hypothetical protein
MFANTNGNFDGTNGSDSYFSAGSSSFFSLPGTLISG